MYSYIIAAVKMRYFFFLFLQENVTLSVVVLSTEALLMGTHDICFLWRNKKSINTS